MPIGALHRVEYALNVLGGNILVEEIAHRIDEDELWTPPLHGLFEAFGAKGQVEARLERVSLDATKTLRKALGIAMVTTGANLRAAGNRLYLNKSIASLPEIIYYFALKNKEKSHQRGDIGKGHIKDSDYGLTQYLVFYTLKRCWYTSVFFNPL